MNDFIKMVVEIEESEDEVYRLKGYLETLSKSLVADFRDEFGVGDGDFGTDIQAAVRLLGELKGRRSLADAKTEILRLAEADGYAYGYGYYEPYELEGDRE